MSEQEKDPLEPIWSSLLTSSLYQTLILSYLNKKFPGSINEMTSEFVAVSKMLEIKPEVKEGILKTFGGFPETEKENNPFFIISNELMADTVIQTLLLRYLMKKTPEMAIELFEDFKQILPNISLNETVKERVQNTLEDYLPEKKA